MAHRQGVPSSQQHRRHRHTIIGWCVEVRLFKRPSPTRFNQTNTIVVSAFSNNKTATVWCSPIPTYVEFLPAPAGKQPPTTCASGRQCQPHCQHHAKEADDQHHVAKHKKTGYQRRYHPVVVTALDQDNIIDGGPTLFFIHKT